MRRKILITGGGGFIGSNLVRHLNRARPEVELVVLDDFSSGAKQNLSGTECTVFEGSVLDYPKVLGATHLVDQVVHLAALGSVPRSIENPRASFDANAMGTLNILEAARESGARHVVVASSSSVYGTNPSSPRSEDDWTRPMSPYAASKLATESLAIAYGLSFGMKALALRFFNVYGPGQSAEHDYAAVIPRFVSSALAGEGVTIHGDGTQSRDFTFVRTICETIEQACINEVHAPHPVNAAFGTSTSIVEIVALLEKILGTKVEVAYTARRTGDVSFSQADSQIFKRMFPTVREWPLDEGLAETIRWFQSRA